MPTTAQSAGAFPTAITEAPSLGRSSDPYILASCTAVAFTSPTNVASCVAMGCRAYARGAAASPRLPFTPGALLFAKTAA